MDELKKYLQENRSSMDADVPPANMWQRIKKEEAVQKPAGKVIWMSLKFAATACVLTAIFFGVKWMTDDNKPAQPTASNITPVKAQDNSQIVEVQPQHDTTQLSTNKNTEPTADALLEDFQQTYGSLVKMQLSSIRSTPVLGEEPAYFNEFKTMLNQIGVEEAMIKKRIKTNGVTTELLEQLINVYQQKLDILKSLHAEIDKMNNKVKQNHPSSDSLSAYYINI